MNEVKQAKIRVKRVESGWILELLSGDSWVISELYGTEFNQLTNDKKIFHPEFTLKQAVDFVLDIAKEQGFQVVSIQPDTLEVLKEIVPEPITFFVDFRWSLWITEKGEWIDKEGKDLYVKLEKAYMGESNTVKIRTAPKKEIRYGEVTIYKGEAIVHFETEWDEISRFIPENCPLELEEEVMEWMTNYFIEEGYGLEINGENPIGAEITTSIKADTFEELMLKIDNLENELLELEKNHFKIFQTYLHDYFNSLISKRN